jgi:hypothetical protein
MNRTFEEFKRDRKIWRQLRTKISHLEKIWLLDCGADYRIYLSRLYKLAADHEIEIPKEK